MRYIDFAADTDADTDCGTVVAGNQFDSMPGEWPVQRNHSNKMSHTAAAVAEDLSSAMSAPARARDVMDDIAVGACQCSVHPSIL